MKGRPTATRTMLEARASLLTGLRAFFEARHSLEVDVPAIAQAPASDPWLDSFTVNDGLIVLLSKIRLVCRSAIC